MRMRQASFSFGQDLRTSRQRSFDDSEGSAKVTSLAARGDLRMALAKAGVKAPEVADSQRCSKSQRSSIVDSTWGLSNLTKPKALRLLGATSAKLSLAEDRVWKLQRSESKDGCFLKMGSMAS
mmetsp:Transcript_66664/g.117883  ORF Transcript_66664/g.117883 Transcript_66664/m.117883 type:complete len:123 (+) Transcript_66664:600-968(+)